MAKRTIPEIRARLFDIADELLQPAHNPHKLSVEIRQLANETIRNSPSRPRAKTKHAPLTVEQEAAICRMAARYPDMHLDEIAKAFNTNPGRVSEAIRKNKS